MKNIIEYHFKTPGWEERIGLDILENKPKNTQTTEEQIIQMKEAEKLTGLSEQVLYRNRVFRYNFDKKSIEYLGMENDISEIPLFHKNILPILWLEDKDYKFYYRNIELEALCDELDFQERLELLEGLSEIVNYKGLSFRYNYDTYCVEYLENNIVIKEYAFPIEHWEKENGKEYRLRNLFLEKLYKEITLITS